MQSCVCGNSDYTKFYRYLNVDEEEHDLLGVTCSPCGQEWLREDYLSNEGEGRLIFGNLVLKQQNGLPADVQTAFQVKGSRTRIDRNNFYSLKAGDHIAWHRPYIIWHHAILIEVDSQTGRLHVLHWNIVDGKDTDKIQVFKEWLNAEEQLGDLFRIDYPEEILQKNPPHLVLARAHSRLGEVGFGLLKNNCEGLAAFCKTGVRESCQTKWFWEKLKEVGATTIGQCAKTVTKTVCAGVKETIKAGAAITAEEAAKSAGKIAIAETIETVQHASNWVGAGIVIAIEGGFCIWDLTKIYQNRKDGHISRKDFIETTSQRVTEAVLAAGFAIGGSLLGELIGGAAGAAVGSVVPVFGTAVGASIGVFIGSIIGGVLGSLAGKALGSAVGPYVGKAINHFIRRDDRAVASVRELNRGDHIVIYRWCLHQRHHAIFVETNLELNKMRIVHNTYKHGVSYEWVDFDSPVYRVIYGENECYPSEDVVSRALSKVGEDNYRLISFNCKGFARWCKEGM